MYFTVLIDRDLENLRSHIASIKSYPILSSFLNHEREKIGLYHTFYSTFILQEQKYILMGIWDWACCYI